MNLERSVQNRSKKEKTGTDHKKRPAASQNWQRNAIQEVATTSQQKIETPFEMQNKKLKCTNQKLTKDDCLEELITDNEHQNSQL